MLCIDRYNKNHHEIHKDEIHTDEIHKDTTDT